MYSSQEDQFFEDLEMNFEPDYAEEGQNVKGRLKSRISFWEKIGANETIIDILKNGYKIPFLETPEPSVSRNNKSALENMDFVEQSVNDLLKNGCVVETPFIPHTVNPLSVSKNKQGKKRLILDLRKINKYLWKDKFTFEDWKIGIEYFQKDAFCFKFDLSKSYHHIDIFPQHQQFLGFCVNGKYYCFTVLAFGLSSAPFCFSKCLREMVKYWRNYGIKIIMFLDDGFSTNKTLQLASADAIFVRQSLIQAGFVINNEKSIWAPVQMIEWIGIFWDSIEFSISIPMRRIEDCLLQFSTLLSNMPFVTARILAQCTGKIMSLSPVFGNITRLMTRYLYMEIETRKSWNFVYELQSTSSCITEINFWRDNIVLLNKRYLSVYNPTYTLVYSDASNLGPGSYIVNCRDSVYRSLWSESEKHKSSTFREVKAVRLALRAYGDILQGRTVKWFSDSQSCVKVIQAGSTKSDLQLESLKFFDLCIKWNIDLRIQWVPREQNDIADTISKMGDTDEWEVTVEFFDFMNELWGPYDIDRFASHRNRKVQRYNSKFIDFETEAVDAFTQFWGHSNNWLTPPIRLVTRTIFHLLHCKASGTIIVPKWPSCSFWPILFKRNGDKQAFITEILEFNIGQNIFTKNDSMKKCILDSTRFKSKVLALRILAQ